MCVYKTHLLCSLFKKKFKMCDMQTSMIKSEFEKYVGNTIFTCNKLLKNKNSPIKLHT